MRVRRRTTASSASWNYWPRWSVNISRRSRLGQFGRLAGIKGAPGISGHLAEGRNVIFGDCHPTLFSAEPDWAAEASFIGDFFDEFLPGLDHRWVVCCVAMGRRRRAERS